MAAQVDIYNLALGRVGITTTVADIDEPSVEARACNRYYAVCRDTCLEDFSWSFARRFAVPVALSATLGVWAYAWAKPGDALVIRRAYQDDSLTTELDWQEVSYIGEDDASHLALVTDHEPAWIEYTGKVTDPSRFSASFVDAVAWRLAADVAMTQARARDLRSDAMQAYQDAIARAAGRNQKMQRKTLPDNEFLRARS